MPVLRRSARIAAKAAKAAAVPHPVVPMSDVQKIRDMLIRCENADGQLARIKATTEMFILLRTACLWESNAYFRRTVEMKICDFLEKQIPVCLSTALQTNDSPLEWALYDLKDAIENLKMMMDDSPPITEAAKAAPVTPADPFMGLTGAQRARAERAHKENQEREALRWRYYGPLSDAVNDVREKLNLLFEPGSKGWWIAFDAHPTVQEWQGVFFQMMNASSGN